MAIKNKGCNVCDKQGLPIFVSRFGCSSSPTSTKPSLPIPATYPKLSGSGLYYEVTSIRKTGYIYVFDELDNSFYYFRKNDYGVFVKKTIGKTISTESNNGMHEPCKKDGQRVRNGMLITVPNANASRKIWLAFSAHLWTGRIIQLHKDAKYRAKHMSLVTVGHPIGKFHCPITDLAKVKNTGISVETAKLIVNECDRLAKGKGIIVALHDPVAMMVDIQVAIENKGAKFFDHDEVKKVYFSDVTLSALEAGIPESLRKQSRESYEADLKRMQQSQSQRQARYGFDPVQMTEKRFEEQRQKDLNAKMQSEWGKYAKKINPTLRKSKLAEIKQQQMAYDKKNIYPLANIMKQWMNFDQIKSYFMCQFDSKSIASGVVYAHEATLAIGGSCALDPIRIELAQKLKALKFSDDNFFLNALALNYEKLKSKVVESFGKLKPSIENPFRDIPWDGLFGSFSDSVDRNVQSTTGIFFDKLGSFMALAFGPLFNMLCQGLLSASNGGIAVLSMAMMYNLKLNVLNVQNIRTAKVARAVAGRMISFSIQQGGSATPYLNSNRAALEVELKYRIDELVTRTGLTKAQLKREMVVVEKIFKQGVTVTDFAKSLESETSIQKWNDQWKTEMQTKVSAIGSSVKVNFAIGSAALIGAFQGWVLTKLYDDAFGDTTMKNDENENIIRFGLGVAAVGTAIAATIEKSLGLYRTLTSSIVSNTDKFVSGATKYLGAIAGFGVAIMDAYAGYNAYKEGNTALTYLYLTSAIGGACLAGLAIYTSTAAYAAAVAAASGSSIIPFIGWIIAIGVGLMIGLSVVISKLKDNPLQDWVERSSFGTLEKGRYSTYKLMQSEFEKAMKAIVK